MSFSFRLKMNHNEVEISGSHKQVLMTIDELPKLVANVSKAFTHVNLGISTKKLPEKSQATSARALKSAKYPSIPEAKNCSQAVLKLLQTHWGLQKPRTLSEIKEALEANAIHYPSTTLSGVLYWLIKKAEVRRWKTDAGYVYTLLEKEEA